jgi:Holliday junction resolvasome RuvABC endonuclease subunit
MIILAFDPGNTTGFAVHTSHGFEEYGVLPYKKGDSLSKYLTEIKALLNVWSPDRVYFCQNVMMHRGKSVFSLHRKMTLIELACEQHDIPVIATTDNHCRKVVCGNGRAGKEWAMEWAEQELGRRVGHDVADACVTARAGWMEQNPNVALSDSENKT